MAGGIALVFLGSLIVAQVLAGGALERLTLA